MAKRQLAWDVRLEAGDKAGEPYDLVLSVYDTVVSPSMGAMFGGVTAQGVLAELRSKRKAQSVLVRINSGGGSVTEGFAIYNLLMEIPAHITTRVDGLAGSIASVIMMAGEERQIARNAVVMIHNPFAMVEGEATELRALANLLDMHAAQMLSIYASRAGLSVEQAKTMCDATTWMSAAEAVALGFCTTITEAEAQVAAALRPEDLGSAPEHVQRLFAAEEPHDMKTAKAKALAPTITPESVAAEQAAEAAKAAEAAAATAAQEAEQAAQAAATLAEGDKSKADMEEMRALLAKKDEEINALKASLAKFGDEDEEEEDEKAQAATRILDIAKELTGKSDLAEVEGALVALADAPKADPKADHEAFVTALVKEGKLSPARKAWALSAPRASVDTYLAGTGGVKVAPVGVVHTADETASRKVAGIDPSQVQLSEQEIHIAKAMGIPLDMARLAHQSRVTAVNS